MVSGEKQWTKKYFRVCSQMRNPAAMWLVVGLCPNNFTVSRIELVAVTKHLREKQLQTGRGPGARVRHGGEQGHSSVDMHPFRPGSQHSLPTKPHLLRVPQSLKTTPPSGDQVLKHVSHWGLFYIKPGHLDRNFQKNTLSWIWERCPWML